MRKEQLDEIKPWRQFSIKYLQFSIIEICLSIILLCLMAVYDVIMLWLSWRHVIDQLRRRKGHNKDENYIKGNDRARLILCRNFTETCLHILKRNYDGKQF